MKENEAKVLCPFGSECYEIKDNVPYRCALSINMRGTNPNTGEPIDEWKCTFYWTTILLLENSKKLDGIQSATESFRNEMVNGQIDFNNLIAHSIKMKQVK